MKQPRYYNRPFSSKVILLQEKADSEWLPLLPEAMTDLNGRIFFRDIRYGALVALRLCPPSARSVLEPGCSIEQVRQLLEETVHSSEEARAEAVRRLGEVGENILLNDILERLVAMLSDCSPTVRKAAALSLDKLGPTADNPSVLEGLQRMVAESSEEERAIACKALKTISWKTNLSLAAAGESSFDSRPNEPLRSIVYRLQDRRISAALVELPEGNTALTVETSDSFFAETAVRYALGGKHGVIQLLPFQGVWSATVMLALSFQTATGKIPAFELLPSSSSGEKLGA